VEDEDTQHSIADCIYLFTWWCIVGAMCHCQMQQVNRDLLLTAWCSGVKTDQLS